MTERRLYSSWTDADQPDESTVNFNSGIIRAKQALNELHTYLGDSGFSEVEHFLHFVSLLNIFIYLFSYRMIVCFRFMLIKWITMLLPSRDIILSCMSLSSLWLIPPSLNHHALHHLFQASVFQVRIFLSSPLIHTNLALYYF